MDGKLLGDCEARSDIVEWNKTSVQANLAAGIVPWPDIAKTYLTWSTSLETSWAPPTEATEMEEARPGQATTIPALTDGFPA